ncbi:MAG: endonuclease/exonuclease/phosphatase family protein [Planctomycetales bacterium]|nr:endonuclease/exonuclease/phosphatase family protein [Planctomycetales bacterium]
MNDISFAASGCEPSETSTSMRASVKGSLGRQVFTAIARLLCLASVLTTVLTFGARYFWVSELLANLRIQQVIAITVSLGLSLVLRQWRLSALTAVCLLIHLLTIVPQVAFNGTEGRDLDNPIRVMSMNVLTSNRSFESIANEIRQVDPDLIAVIEMSSELREYMERHFVDHFPYSVTHAEDFGNFGIGIFSKFPLSETDVFRLNEDIQSIEVRCNGRRIIATHPIPPMGDRLFRSRNEHLQLLAKRTQQSLTESPQIPVIVMGDFNLTPWSPHFLDFESTSGLRRAKQGVGLTPTWYARGASFPMGLVIDHMFVSGVLQIDEYHVGEDIGSDHRSVSMLIGTRPRSGGD